MDNTACTIMNITGDEYTIKGAKAAPVVTTEGGSRGLVSREEVRKAFCNWVMHKGAPYEFLFELENMEDYEEYL